MKKVFYLLLILGGALIVACGRTIYEPEPVGIGYDYTELKRSPCACLEIKKAPQLPDWMV